jgi:hypothetical protein
MSVKSGIFFETLALKSSFTIANMGCCLESDGFDHSMSDTSEEEYDHAATEQLVIDKVRKGERLKK